MRTPGNECRHLARSAAFVDHAVGGVACARIGAACAQKLDLQEVLAGNGGRGEQRDGLIDAIAALLLDDADDRRATRRRQDERFSLAMVSAAVGCLTFQSMCNRQPRPANPASAINLSKPMFPIAVIAFPRIRRKLAVGFRINDLKADNDCKRRIWLTMVNIIVIGR
jgi:hypothetical protein